jgi:tol-pal system protein YbgF
VIRAGIACVLAAAVTGCAGRSLTATADIDALRQTSVTTQEELRELRSLVEQSADRRTDTDAELLLAIEDLEARFARIEAQLVDLLDGLARFQAPRSAAPAPAGAGTGDDIPEGAMPPPGVAAGEPPSMVATPGNPRSRYEAAYLDVTRGNYDAAITAFESFVRDYPSDDLADNAVYWIGECYYAKREFNRAAEAFVRLIDAYPSGDKVPAAMLKLGFAFQENGDPVAARRYLETLVDRFPESEEATKARARLAEL